MTRQFWTDAAERCLKAFAYSVIAFFGVGNGFDAFHADWGNALSLGLGAAILSVLGSVASYKVGNSGTASLTTAVEPSGRHAAL
jgi:hypothetical protein